MSSVFASSCSSYTIDSIVLDVATKYCSTYNLKSLRIANVSIPPVIKRRLEPIFKRLYLLHLDSVEIIGDEATVFENCDALVELKVNHVQNDRAIFENIFPKLERFTCNKVVDYKSCPYIGHPLNFLSSFIARHSTLKSLNLSISFCDESFKVIIPLIIRNSFKELKQLTISIGEISAALLQPLETLKSLQCLKLSFVTFTDFEFISRLPKLRELHLEWCDLPSASNQFASLVELTKLELENCRTPDAFDEVSIISHLIELEELTITRLDQNKALLFLLDEKTFSTIVSTVAANVRRMQVLTLKCLFYFDLDNFDEDQKVRLLYWK